MELNVVVDDEVVGQPAEELNYQGNYPFGAPVSPRHYKFRTEFERKVRLLFLGTFFTIILYVVTGTSIFISLSRTHSDLIDEHVSSLLLLKNVEISIEGSASSGRAFALTGDQKFFDITERRQAESLNLMVELKRYAQNPDEALLIELAEAAVRGHSNTLSELMLLRNQNGTPQEVAKYFDENVWPNREAIRSALSKVETSVNSGFQEAKKIANRTWRWSLALFATAAVLSLLVFFGLFFALARALSQQRRTEAELAFSAMIARQSVDLTGLGFFNHDHASGSVFWSPQMKLISGVADKNLITIPNYLEMIPEPERGSVKASLEAALDPNGDGIFEVEHRLNRPDGSQRWVMVKAQTFFGQEGESRVARRTIGTMLDISKIKAVEYSLREALADLATEKQKLERSNSELDQFASIAAHDLRAPITSMLGWVGVLDRLVPKPRDSRVDQAIEFIERNTKKADAMIGDLLEVARVTESRPQEEFIDLNRVVKDTLLVLKNSIKRSGAKIQVDKLPTAFGCPSQFESLFSNLIRNALTYRDKERPPEISISCRPDHKFYEFIVKDNGIGIDSQYRERIFEMFRRLHSEEDYGGTGIGLAYCKKVVELHGGKIWVESVPGQGSEFHFTYPIQMSERGMA